MTDAWEVWLLALESMRKNRTAAEAGTIFLSYRRVDSDAWAGRLADALARIFGKDAVFRDIDNLIPGCDYQEELKEKLDRCKVALVMIGPKWLAGVKGGEDASQNPGWLKMEVKTTLARGIPVIPILVPGGTLPSPDDLTEDIRSLAFRQSFQLTDAGFDERVATLTKLLVEEYGLSGDVVKPVRQGVTLAQRLRRLAFFGILGPIAFAVGSTAHQAQLVEVSFVCFVAFVASMVGGSYQLLRIMISLSRATFWR